MASTGELDPQTAIAFCILANSTTTTNDDDDDDDKNNLSSSSAAAALVDFESFYDWFVDLEEQWLDAAAAAAAAAEDAMIENQITLAPFHPDWAFASDNDDNDNDDCLAFLKKSPFPTVSLVSAAVIEKAGVAATKQIGRHNTEYDRVDEQVTGRMETHLPASCR